VAAFTFPEAKNKSLQEFAVVPRAVVGKVRSTLEVDFTVANHSHSCPQIPSNISLLNAATYPDNFVTAFWTLFSDKNLGLPIPDVLPATSTPPRANEPILIYGASTSAGIYMIQLLKIAGYRNIVAVASQRNHEYLKSLGATHTVDYRSADFTSELLKVTNGQKFNLAVDIIGARSSLTALSKVVGSGAKFAVLIPVKEGDSVTNHPDTKMTPEIEPWVTDLFAGVDIRPVATFTCLSVSL
jgi:NADPH:quinone reductase-like Zn-dependent oxidoreductase